MCFKKNKNKKNTAAGTGTRASPSPPQGTPFDITRQIGLVPPFRENDVDTFFAAFERVATALRWPEDVWSILLQCKLTGKAQEAVAALSVQDSMQYNVVKSAILRAYELVPEAYRQKFRNHSKSSNQTYVEFAREEETLFDKWCVASQATDAKAMRELMLLEEFKRCIPERVTVHLNEQRVNSVAEAAIFADEFVLSHKSVFDSSPNSQAGEEKKEERVCHYCKKPGHLIADCRKREQRNAQNGSKSEGFM